MSSWDIEHVFHLIRFLHVKCGPLLVWPLEKPYQIYLALAWPSLLVHGTLTSLPISDLPTPPRPTPHFYLLKI